MWRNKAEIKWPNIHSKDTSKSRGSWATSRLGQPHPNVVNELQTSPVWKTEQFFPTFYSFPLVQGTLLAHFNYLVLRCSEIVYIINKLSENFIDCQNYITPPFTTILFFLSYKKAQIPYAPVTSIFCDISFSSQFLINL